MNESRICGGSQERRPRPPIVKMTRALVSAAVAQGQPKVALQLMTNALQTVRALPPAEQFELAIGVVEEAGEEFGSAVGRRLGWTT